MQQIGEELRVVHVLEGSVRREGNRIRLAGQLINARTDAQLWAKTFDRDLTDIFAIQSELALEIATALNTVLTSGEKQRLERKRTSSLDAYDAYLQARSDFQSSFIVVRNRRPLILAAAERLQEAVTLDPQFVEAWTQLAEVHGYIYFWDLDRTSARADQARQAIESAVRLSPDDPAVMLGLGHFYYLVHRDWPRARAEFEQVARRQPGNLRAQFLLAITARRQGDWDASLQGLREVHLQDPRDWDPLDALADTLLRVRRFDEAAHSLEQLATLRPDEPGLSLERALMDFYARGSRERIDEFLRSDLATASAEVAELQGQAAWILGDADGFVDSCEPTGAAADSLTDVHQVRLGAALLVLEEPDRARDVLTPLRTRLESQVQAEPGNATAWENLALACAFLGDGPASLAAAGQATDLISLRNDARMGSRTEMTRAIAFAWAGQSNQAIAEVTRLLQVPCDPDLNVHHLRVGLEWGPLQGLPEFESLLADPSNNEPIDLSTTPRSVALRESP